jgi:beta-galactosidase GanA
MCVLWQVPDGMSLELWVVILNEPTIAKPAWLFQLWKLLEIYLKNVCQTVKQQVAINGYCSLHKYFLFKTSININGCFMT